ncbi:hypothetical protein EV426DRAFT_161850 [Tirmania nivea]|nr:hypothetical protein EV426DRAFT_161850 [Tirmania nivea]
MRLLPPLLALLALLPSANAKKETKLQRLTALATNSARSGPGPLALTDKTFEDLTSGPRNYTALVLLTALDPRFGCHLCKEFQPEFELLAKSWLRKHKDSNGFFFANLDFSHGRHTFQKLGLTSAPVLYLFPATYGPTSKPNTSLEPLRYEFLPVQHQADHVSHFVSQHTPFTLPVRRPTDYTQPLLLIATLTLLAVLFTLALPHILPLLTHPTLWAAVSLISVLVFISGHMFNHIRHTPYVGHNPKTGMPTYIAGGFSTQFAAESQIVGLVYAFLSFGTIALGMKIPRIKEAKRQGVAVAVWSGVVLILFSFLMALFKVKNGSYPFWLPPFMGAL